MPFQMKIQPVNSSPEESSLRKDPVKAVVKSRFKRLIEKQLPCVLRISSPEIPAVEELQNYNGDFEPSSVCLANMVKNFIEDTNNDKHLVVSSKCGRNRCNCFSRSSSNDSSDDEFHLSGCSNDSITTFSGEACENLKSLVPCPSLVERNLLADTAKIVDMNKSCKGKADCRKIVSDGLLALGYDVAICKSRWEKCSSYPAGEYEYVDVIVENERLLVDVDFRSEFEIARPTGNYKSVLQSLPSIFVGKSDRLQQIIRIVSESAKQSLKKKELHFPPWRKSEYMIAKWLSPHTRSSSSSTTTITPTIDQTTNPTEEETKIDNKITNQIQKSESLNFSGEFELLFPEKTIESSSSIDGSSDGGKISLPMKSKSSQGGLTSVLEEKP